MAVECRLPRESDPRPRGLHPVQSDDARSIITSVWGGAWVRWSWEYPPSFPELFKAVVGERGGGAGAGVAVGSPGYGRPCELQRQVPAVFGVRGLGGAPVPVHRLSGGHSCCACRGVFSQCKLCRRPWSSFRFCSWTVPPPGIGGVGFGPFSYLHEAHHLRVVSAIRVWLGNESGFRRPSLEREVQLDVRVHSSSCGSLRDVVHSPLKGSTIVAVGVFALRCRVWWKFHS